jgi:hypothetical protein
MVNETPNVVTVAFLVAERRIAPAASVSGISAIELL